MMNERLNEDRATDELSTADLAGATAQRATMQDEGTVPVAPTQTGLDATMTGSAAESAPAPQATPLLAAEASQEFRSRWEAIQIGFVDEPRRAVEQADGLVAESIQQLAKSFADERSTLETQWAQGDDISTEDLRVALQRYRSFFERLLAV